MRHLNIHLYANLASNYKHYIILSTRSVHIAWWLHSLWHMRRLNEGRQVCGHSDLLPQSVACWIRLWNVHRDSVRQRCLWLENYSMHQCTYGLHASRMLSQNRPGQTKCWDLVVQYGEAYTYTSSSLQTTRELWVWLPKSHHHLTWWTKDNGNSPRAYHSGFLCFSHTSSNDFWLFYSSLVFPETSSSGTSQSRACVEGTSNCQSSCLTRMLCNMFWSRAHWTFSCNPVHAHYCTTLLHPNLSLTALIIDTAFISNITLCTGTRWSHLHDEQCSFEFHHARF